MSFVEVSYKDFTFNPFELIGEEWMLITAGNESSFNTMTAAWGQMGFLWRLPVATIYVRPQRYTKDFIDKTDEFTLSFFGPSAREALQICGTQSGRDTDKVQDAGLTPVPINDSMTFEEAQLVFVCHKIYKQDVNPADFHEKELIGECYSKGDFSVQYIGRVDHVYVREDIYKGAAQISHGGEHGCCGGHGGEGHGHGHGSGEGGCCGGQTKHNGQGGKAHAGGGHGGCCRHEHPNSNADAN